MSTPLFSKYIKILAAISHNFRLYMTFCQPGQGLAKQDQGWQNVGGVWRGNEA
jgi:hypothetical protein